MNIYFLPYSAACIWAYAATRKKIVDHYCLDTMIWKRDDIDTVAHQLSTNHVVAFSTYIWNRNYNYTLAEQIKKINPAVIIVFGGPEVPVTDKLIFDKKPYIDYIIKKEGELTFANLLESLIDNATTPGLLINQAGTLIDTGDAERITDLSQLPSPYQTGIFDQLIADNPEISWNATLETNRGCPYQCTFCDWGSLTYNKVRQFDSQRVFDDITWITQHANGVYVADANFGMFVERDRQFVEHLLACQEKHQRLDYFFTNWAKNQTSGVVELIQMLSSRSSLMNNGLTVSVQSLDENVLDIIKRKNLKQHRIREIYNLAKKSNIMTYTELILALPGETYESFQKNIFECLDSNLHHGIEIIQAQLLENAEMNLVQKELYHMQSIEMSDYIMMHQGAGHGPLETIAVVTETDTLSKKQMTDVWVWSSFMQAMHFYGFSTQLARFVNRYCAVSFADFYKQLYQDFLKDPHFMKIHDTMHSQFNDWLTHGHLPNPAMTTIPFNGINLWVGMTLLIFEQNLLEHLQNWLDQHIRDNYELAPDLHQQLMTHQKSITLDTSVLDTVVIDYDYDFVGYLDNDLDLHRPVSLEYTLKPLQQNLSHTMFLENIFYKRRQEFGLKSVDYVK